MINYLVATAIAKEGFLARIVPECDPSNTNSDPSIPDCDWNQLLIMGQNIVNFLIGAAFIITTLLIVVGAFRMMISAGDVKAIGSAKANITSAVYGLVIVLISWVVMNSLIAAFVDKNKCTGTWWKFESLQCGEYIGEEDDGSADDEEAGIYCENKPGAQMQCDDLKSRYTCTLGIPGLFSLNQYCEWNDEDDRCIYTTRVGEPTLLNLCAKVDCTALAITDTSSAQRCAAIPCCQVPEGY